MATTKVNNSPGLLEVIVTNASEAKAAEDGGAHRLELVRDFAAGGLTPEFSIIESVLAAVTIPVRVMVRETDSYELQDADERERVFSSIKSLNELPVDGIVIGFVHEMAVDETILEEILKLVPGQKFTFHRAFEATCDPIASINYLKRFKQIDRILTNSGKGSWTQRMNKLLSWQQYADPITILVGGDVTRASLVELACSGLREFHVGRSARHPETFDGQIDRSKIAALRSIISNR